MKKVLQWGMNRYALLFILLSVIFSNTSCDKPQDEPAAPATEEDQSDLTARGGGGSSNNQLKDYLQINLVANNASYGAPNIDPLLINGWGIAFSATGTPWVGSQGGHVSTIYNREGVTALPAVHISSPAANEGGNPTGVVFNPLATDFLIPAGNGTANAAARFIFVGVDGVVSGWNGTWGNHSYRQFNHVATSSYTGLTLASKDSSNYLYAADFKAGKIRVWDKNWNPVNMSFKDWNLPWGYYPFNIQVIGDKLYVTYAKKTNDGRSQAGEGKGIVNVFSTDGRFVKRFASHDELNAPWGVAMAPASFFGNEEDDNRHGHGNGHGNGGHHGDNDPVILIGNFGDGHINVFSARGKSLGQLKKNNRTLVIDGLWALTFPPSTSTIDPNRLYFAAGPKHETNGIFGYVIKDSTAH